MSGKTTARWLRMGSMRGAAAREVRRASGGPKRRQWLSTLGTGVGGLWNSPYPIAWILPLLMLGLWVPNLPTPAQLDSELDAERTIGALLTVVAATQALAIAVIVFAAQAYNTSRHARYGG